VNRLPPRHTGYCVPPLAPPGAAHGYCVGRMTLAILVGTGAMCSSSGPRAFVRPGERPPLASATSGARWSGATGWCRSRKLQRVIQVVGRGQVGLLPVWAEETQHGEAMAERLALPGSRVLTSGDRYPPVSQPSLQGLPEARSYPIRRRLSRQRCRHALPGCSSRRQAPVPAKCPRLRYGVVMGRAKLTIPMRQLEMFCRRQHIRKLALFGSVLGGRLALDRYYLYHGMRPRAGGGPDCHECSGEARTAPWKGGSHAVPTTQ